MSPQVMTRVATKLQEQWQLGLQHQQDQVVPLMSVIQPYLKRFRHAEYLLSLARSHGLELIKPSLEEKVQFQARSLRITLQDHENVHFPVRRQFLWRNFYQDLLQLEQEFVDLQVNWDESVLVVETEAIILEDVELGHFSIRLNWKQWAQERSMACLKIVAEDPNTAELNDEITHPHVRDGELCAGEAITALHKALNEGRLAEAFLIVRSVLTTYNRNSAYVRLDEWQGIPCYDCGNVTNPDDRAYCDGCQHDYCSSCISSCASCGDSRCLSCVGTCSACQENCCGNCSMTSAISDQELCRSCREVCPDCQIPVGPGDLHAESGLCPDCHVDDSETPPEETLHESLCTTAS